MHKLAIKQTHESLLILLRFRTNGHNARIFYCMGETAIVYITVVILLTPRGGGGGGGGIAVMFSFFCLITTPPSVEQSEVLVVVNVKHHNNDKHCNVISRNVKHSQMSHDRSQMSLNVTTLQHLRGKSVR